MQCGPAQAEGTVRPGDRILALNGKSLVGVKLAELQSLMYQEEGETVFTLEYDVAKQVRNLEKKTSFIVTQLCLKKANLINLEMLIQA